MALKIKNDDNDESSEDEDTKLKSFITRQLKKFIKNANVKTGNKDRKQSAFSQFKSQDKGKREFKDAGQGNCVPIGPKCYGCQGFGRMKQEYPTYIKSIGKTKALAATLSDTNPEADFDESDQDGIVSAFTAIVESLEEAVHLIDEEEELIESKFEKMDDQDDIRTAYTKLYKVSEKHEKLYRLAKTNLNEVELECEEQSTKVDEANQNIEVLRFENNLLVEKTKKLDAELFQVRTQLKRTSSAKLDEMLNFQKSAFDKTGLGYDDFLPSCSTFSNALNRVTFVPPANNNNSKVTNPKTKNVSEDKNDKGKSILGAPPKVGKKKTKQNNHRSTNKKSQPKKPHFCHHYGASRHTHPNCYKWIATQQSNSVSSFGSQNHFQLSLAPLGELLKVVMLLSKFNGFNSPSYLPKQRFIQKKVLEKIWFYILYKTHSRSNKHKEQKAYLDVVKFKTKT